MDIQVADERRLVEAMLDRQRSEITHLLDDLTDSEARRQLVTSLTTPLGLVKHAIFVEKVWFHSRVAGLSRRAVGLVDSVDESFQLDDSDTVSAIRDQFLAACAHSRVVAQTRRLDDQFSWHHTEVSLRFIYQHLIAELARHAGHGDILVEQIKSQRRER
ncbi:MAG: DUF664 domain-containing protein [Antricoccus sp.]